jgi:lysophospholipase L1-like esterase
MGDLCLANGQTMVLLGDSITDGGRRVEAPPLGSGYVAFFTDLVMAKYPERRLRFLNEGISGNTVLDLTQRWKTDAIAHRPDWLSVLIGINDLHRTLDGLFDLPPDRFRRLYTALLERIRDEVGSRLILLEPFYMITEAEADPRQRTVLGLLPGYLEVVHDLAGAFDARLVRTHQMFQNQLRYRPFRTFCAEPVHPNRTGHLLIAWELLRTLEES